MTVGSSTLGNSNASSVPGSGVSSVLGSTVGSDRRSFTPVPLALTSFQQEIISHLDIPLHLVNREDHSLRFAYAKYKACLEALHTYQEMSTAGTWTGSSLVQYDVIHLFASKSFWHSHYARGFSQLSNFPDIREWLESTDNLDDEKVWGVRKGSYAFADLLEIVWKPKLSGKKKGNESKKSRKVAGASGSGKSSGSGKRKVSGGNSPAKTKKKRNQL